jgi:hypothetical protein
VIQNQIQKERRSEKRRSEKKTKKFSDQIQSIQNIWWKISGGGESHGAE